jgi:hypothetical protein
MNLDIKPDDIPDDAAPLEGADHLVENAITYKNRLLTEGANMAISLLTGQFFVGRVELVDRDHFTVGTSDPIPDVLLESARVV